MSSETTTTRQTNCKTVHLVVKGHVQGVFFRASTKRRADELALVGWVRNLPNGHVEVEASGDETALRALVEFCRSGPPQARVISVTENWREGSQDLRRFEVRN